MDSFIEIEYLIDFGFVFLIKLRMRCIFLGFVQEEENNLNIMLEVGNIELLNLKLVLCVYLFGKEMLKLDGVKIVKNKIQ